MKQFVSDICGMAGLVMGLFYTALTIIEKYKSVFKKETK